MRILLIFSIFSLLFSCEKNKVVDQDSFSNCNSSQHLDSLSISNKLIGTWSLSNRFCGIRGSILPIRFNVKVNFSSTNSFMVTDNTGILTQGDWKIKLIDSISWGLDLTSPSDYLYGRILFCKNELMFNNSYVDGCDNTFYK